MPSTLRSRRSLRRPPRRGGPSAIHIIILLLKINIAVLTLVLISQLVLSFFAEPEATADHNPSTPTPSPTVTATPAPTPDVIGPPATPEWVQENLLDINEYSRPGIALEQVNGVVVHYTGNPGTTAEQNRSYFNNLAQTHETYASSNFVIGMDGTIILCVPMDEVAYCTGERNYDTLSIEVCHPDDTGEFTQEAYDALVRLVQFLIDHYQLQREDILRHYDVMGKECPRWFVEHPEDWQAFLDEFTYAPDPEDAA